MTQAKTLAGSAKDDLHTDDITGQPDGMNLAAVEHRPPAFLRPNGFVNRVGDFRLFWALFRKIDYTILRNFSVIEQDSF